MNMNEKFLTGLKTLSTEQQTLVFAFIKGLEAQKEIDKSAQEVEKWNRKNNQIKYAQDIAVIKV